jgi:hypothetical protein
MTELQEQIWNYLKEHSVGISNTIRFKDLAKELGIESLGSNSDNLRPVITELVKKYQLPIGTCERGVFLFTNNKEKEIAIDFVDRETKADVLRTINLYDPQ